MFKKIALFVSVILLLIPIGLLCACSQNASNPQASFSNNLKDSMDEAEQKLSTTLLQLANDKFLPTGKTKDQLISDMKGQDQIKDFSSNGKTIVGVYVYIQLAGDADMKILDTYVLSTENKDDKAKLSASWVDITRLKEIASLKEVKTIQEVTKPVTRTT